MENEKINFLEDYFTKFYINFIKMKSGINEEIKDINSLKQYFFNNGELISGNYKINNVVYTISNINFFDIVGE